MKKSFPRLPVLVGVLLVLSLFFVSTNFTKIESYNKTHSLQRYGVASVFSQLFTLGTKQQTVAVKKCFACVYDDFNQKCEAGKTKQSCSKIKPEGHSELNCTWSNESCMSLFKKQCQNEVEKRKDSKKYYWPTGWSGLFLKDEEAVIFPEACTDIEYITRGHSSSERCSSFIDSASVCIAGLPIGGIATIINNGCSTFASSSQAINDINDILSKVPKECTASITANQAPSNILDCTDDTHMTVTFNCKGIVSITYGACHTGSKDDHCYEKNSVVFCTDSKGKKQTEKCCVNYSTKGSYQMWVAGTECPLPPSPPKTHIICVEDENSIGHCRVESGEGRNSEGGTKPNEKCSLHALK